ncbi:MAG: lytic transglycosylase domain-containing protein [Blastocatellia bacterium]|nr:lytic transglycosylase domain-containing protein [Blastocatellia bacterium]
MARFHKYLCLALVGLFLTAGTGLAQTPASGSYTPVVQSTPGQTPAWVTQLTQKAENYFLLGTRAFDEGRFDTAREYFNLSLDTLLESGAGTRSNAALNTYYVQLIERIRHYDLHMQQNEVGWGQQTFSPSPLDLLAEVDVTAEVGSDTEILNDLDFDAQATTPEVRGFVRYFTGPKGRPTLVSGLRRAGRFFHLSRRIFGEEKVPLDLIWLAQAESGWRNNALSTAAAYGIWQFMPATGSRFGLIQNAWIDERGGIEQPTRAAARYLRWLYNRYGDWLLAMAAYNCGEGNVDKAIARSHSKDFWTLHRAGLLPQETRNYVPIILSIILVAKHPDRYGIEFKADPPLTYETMPLVATADLRELSNLTGTPLETLRTLNPELLQNVTPPAPYQLRVPRGSRTSMQNALVAMSAMTPRTSTRQVSKKRGRKAAPSPTETVTTVSSQ